jgi:hypothetical protein
MKKKAPPGKRYYYYWLYVDWPPPKDGSVARFRCVARFIARRIEQNEHYIMYKDQSGLFYLCVDAHEHTPNITPRKKDPDVVLIWVRGFWLKDRSREKILARVAGWWATPEDMHEATGYDS